MKKIRWYYAAAAFAVALIILGVGVYLWEIYKEAPLKEEIEALPGVETVEIVESNDTMVIEMETSYMNSLKEIIKESDRIVEKHLGNNQDYRYRLTDNPNTEMQVYREDIKPALHEGARKGNYREIKTYVEEISRVYSFEEVKFMVDSSRLYLQVKQGEDHLFVMVPLYLESSKEEV